MRRRRKILKIGGLNKIIIITTLHAVVMSLHCCATPVRMRSITRFSARVGAHDATLVPLLTLRETRLRRFSET